MNIDQVRILTSVQFVSERGGYPPDPENYYMVD